MLIFLERVRGFGVRNLHAGDPIDRKKCNPFAVVLLIERVI